MLNVLYSTNGDGCWFRREWAKQCRHKVFFGRRCQGVKGHKGVHWCYNEHGSFVWQDNQDDLQHDGYSGSTPPGHKEWISPVKMMKKCYLEAFTDSEVTDPEIIERLEKDDPPEKGASITRPVDMEKLPPDLRNELSSDP